MIPSVSTTLFLDESGDLGFDTSKKNRSRFFVITILVCEGHGAEKEFKKSFQRTLRNKIGSRKKDMGFMEMKGRKSSLNIKTYFLKNVKGEDWKLYSVILDKENVSQEYQLPKMQERLYNRMTYLLLKEIDFSDCSNINFVVDRRKNKREIQEFNAYIESRLAGFIPLKTRLDIEHLDSQNSYGLQAVDLFCWGVYRKYEQKDELWYAHYKQKLYIERTITVD